MPAESKLVDNLPIPYRFWESEIPRFGKGAVASPVVSCENMPSHLPMRRLRVPGVQSANRK